MKKFKLTLKDPEDKELEADFIARVMDHLFKYNGQLHEPDDCNMSLGEILEPDKLRELTLVIKGADWPSQVEAMGNLVLVGTRRGGDFCTNCGHPDYYYTGGRMLCRQCEYSEPVQDEIYDNGDIGDFSGFLAL